MPGGARTARIVVTNWVHPEVLDLLGGSGAALDANPMREPWPAAELRRRTAEADALMAFMPDRVDGAFLDACPRLKIVAGALKGFDNFDAGACTARGVWLTVVPDLLTEPTAELAVGLVIALGRHILAGDRHLRAGCFAGWRPQLYGSGLAGATVGIVGLGAVGRAIAERLAGFRARLLGWDARPPAAGEAAWLGVGLVPALDDLLAASDVVMLALPLAPGTHHLFGRERLARMKPGARLVNPARGSLVDEAAVAAALESGHLAGYAADVFEMEDWARPDRPHAVAPALLADTARTVLTPHLGSAVDGVRRDIALEAAHSILEALAGRTPRGAVNAPARRPC